MLSARFLCVTPSRSCSRKTEVCPASAKKLSFETLNEMHQQLKAFTVACFSQNLIYIVVWKLQSMMWGCANTNCVQAWWSWVSFLTHQREIRAGVINLEPDPISILVCALDLGPAIQRLTLLRLQLSVRVEIIACLLNCWNHDLKNSSPPVILN